MSVVPAITLMVNVLNLFGNSGNSVKINLTNDDHYSIILGALAQAYVDEKRGKL